MSDLEHISSQEVAGPLRPHRLGIFEDRRHGRELTRLDRRAAIKARALEHEADLGRLRAAVVAKVGTRAMELQALVSLTERMVVEMEPGCVNGVSYISQKITVGLGQVVDRTVEQVVR